MPPENPFDRHLYNAQDEMIDSESFVSGDRSELKSFEGGRIGAVEAQVGDLKFKEEFSDPTVDITHERHTADHEVVSGHSAIRDQDIDFIVQALGRKPSEIEIDGWVTEKQLEIVDSIVSTSYVGVVTARWSGTAVIKDVDIPYSRTWHDKHGWIFEITLALTGVNKGAVPNTMQVSSRVKPEPKDVGIGLGEEPEEEEEEEEEDEIDQLDLDDTVSQVRDSHFTSYRDLTEDMFF